MQALYGLTPQLSNFFLEGMLFALINFLLFVCNEASREDS